MAFDKAIKVGGDQTRWIIIDDPLIAKGFDEETTKKIHELSLQAGLNPIIVGDVIKDQLPKVKPDDIRKALTTLSNIKVGKKPHERNFGKGSFKSKMSRRFIADKERLKLAPPPIAKEKKQGRNSLCMCGSGKKFKHCCLGK